jgi:hypothetical protein
MYFSITGVRLNKKAQDNYFKIKPFQGFLTQRGSLLL